MLRGLLPIMIGLGSAFLIRQESVSFHPKYPQERLNDLGVELAASAALQYGRRLLGGQRLSIRAVGSHGREGIGNRQDSRQLGNLVAGQSVRIALTIESLVVMTHYGRYVPQVVNLRQFIT